MTKGKRGGKISLPANTQANPMAGRNQCIQEMMVMEQSELKAVLNDATATILQKTVASAMLRSLQKGSLSAVQSLLNRLYGTPSHTSVLNNTMKINVRFNKDV